MERVETLARDAVRTIFQSMASLDMAPESSEPSSPGVGKKIIASVGFTGKTSGVIYLYFEVEFAEILASRILGIPKSEFDGEEMISDAMGELSNMVVGYVKSNLQDDGLSLSLTIPTIVRGQQLSVEGASNLAKKMLCFRSGDSRLLVEIFLKDS